MCKLVLRASKETNKDSSKKQQSNREDNQEAFQRSKLFGLGERCKGSTNLPLEASPKRLVYRLVAVVSLSVQERTAFAVVIGRRSTVVTACHAGQIRMSEPTIPARGSTPLA